MVLKVQTKYKELMPLRAEDKPRRELSISEWLKEMAEAGFTGTFKAVNNDGRIYKGWLEQEGEKVVLKSRQVFNGDEAKKRILDKLKND